MSKPLFEIDIASNAHSSLEAHAPLTLIKDSCCFHSAMGLRMPLGIYNISVSRICDKIIRLCRRLEAYFRASDTIEGLNMHDDLMQEIIDYIELSLYAAADHVNDIYSITSGFFKTKATKIKDTAYRKLDKAVKGNKRFVSAAANHIKHQQSRIRIFSTEFMHGVTSGCLHGYFIEGVDAGVVCPSSSFHKNQNVFSITTLVWEIVLFLLNSSRDLASFLQNTATLTEGEADVKSASLSKAVVAAARLPIYTFGEKHPFSRSTLRIIASNDTDESLDSGLYGSIKHGWSKTAGASFGKCISRFEGDGKTRSFRFAQPKSVSFIHWE